MASKSLLTGPHNQLASLNLSPDTPDVVFDKETARIFCNLVFDIQLLNSHKMSKGLKKSHLFTTDEICKLFNYSEQKVKTVLDEMRYNGLLAKVEDSNKISFCFASHYSAFK
jgi:hypothetical protein